MFKDKDPTNNDKKKTQTTNKAKIKKRLHQMQRFVSYFVLSIEHVIHALQRKLDWVENEEGKKAEKFAKIVILKNMYTQQELDVRQRLKNAREKVV